MTIVFLKYGLLIATAPIWWPVLRAFREELVAFLDADLARQEGREHESVDLHVPSGPILDPAQPARTQVAPWDDTDDPTWARTRLMNRAWDTGRPAHKQPPSF